VRPDAVIFDIDGTLIDSVDLHARTWVEAFAHFGYHVPFEQVRPQIGKGGDQLMPAFISVEVLRQIGHELEHIEVPCLNESIYRTSNLSRKSENYC
jgi:beta-phosphoglucomutase-like phosphatase (HAD superfamily)